ncbi:hypothetical protein MIZ01_0866 [Sideroxyarcus emersonii]|uniref:Uncharacterized protein n=2 Tax=Sideroxyarcus emersonii TaxID=2764705 RepID=A0AAN2BYJ4_9PROT|nr:hypothetical protein MIZ01_0866 [Sideroxyarcus emersonii]
MKTCWKKAALVLFAVGGTMLLGGNAQAYIDMPEREHVQTLVWIMEAVTLVTIVTVFWFLWRIGKRAQQSRNPKQDDTPE